MVVVAGFTTRLVPEPTSDPPQQLPVNQSTVHPLATDADNVEDTPPQPADGLADGLVGGAGGVQRVIVTASKALALFTVVTAQSRNMVIALPVAVTVPLKGAHAVLDVPAHRGTAAALDVPPARSTSTDDVALAEFVLNWPEIVYVAHGVNPVTLW